MILIRRLWLAPAIFITLVVYYLFWHAWRSEGHQYGSLSSVHLNPEHYQRKYPLSSYSALPTSKATSIPKIQHDFSKTSETSEARRARLERRDAVKENFLHAWNGYKNHAWAKDEVSPLSGRWRNSFGGWGATLVDTMDTLWIMGMKTEFEQCVEEVGKIDFTTNTEKMLNVFETNIRYLGGLLSAYELSDQQYPTLLAKAEELGEILYIPFDTPNHMPVTRWQWSLTALGYELGPASDFTLLAELGSLTLEFTRLSQLTGDLKYFDAVQRVAKIMDTSLSTTKVPGLWPTIVDAKDLKFDYNHFTFGGMVDSAYEYLPKQYLLLGGADPTYKEMYLRSIEAAKQHIFYRPMTPKGSDILFSGNTGVDQSGATVTEAQGQHLTCFAGGMVAIAAQIFALPDDLDIARKLVEGCIWAYDSMPSGLMPEVFNIASCYTGVTPPDETKGDCSWSDDEYFAAVAKQQPSNDPVAGLSEVEAGKWWVKQKGLTPPYTDISDTRYILRPEAIESIFILYRITGDTALLDSAWRMFQSIEAATRTEIAHAAVSDIREARPPQTDRMESFWLAETLKYFYLIFSEPDLISLDEFVLNTEAHPFRRPRPVKEPVT